MIVDVEDRQLVNMMPGGVQSTISWTRLVAQLRAAGEFSEREIVTHIGADLTGITFRVERRS